MSGRCTHGGCERLATLVVRIPPIGERAMCAVCYRNLTALALDMRNVRPLAQSPYGGAA